MACIMTIECIFAKMQTLINVVLLDKQVLNRQKDVSDPIVLKIIVDKKNNPFTLSHYLRKNYMYDVISKVGLNGSFMPGAS